MPPVFPLADFRLLYPQFAAVSDDAVVANAQMALCYISDHGCDCGDQSWLLMVAHMLTLSQAAQTGGATNPVASATIDKVSVSFVQAPTGTSSFKYWLSSTPFGMQLLAMLARCAAGGLYVGGSRERAAFRIVGGRFPNRGRSWP